MKVLTRRELFSELFSKNTIKQVATAWQGFSEPFKEKKEETLLERVTRLNKKQMINNRKEG